MLNLQDKHVVIFGVASESSIAWAVARRMQAAGARISLGYQQRFKSRVMQLIRSGEVPIASWERCDVTRPAEVASFFDGIDGNVDVLVHSIAYAPAESFARKVSELSQDEFTTALVASSYSLLPLAHAALEDVADAGPRRALTGPAARGDRATLERHLAAMPPEERAGYRAGVALALQVQTGAVVAA